MPIQPYLFFEGRCDEALAFYRRALGAEVLTLLRYKDSPAPPAPGTLPPGGAEKIMHASVRIGESTVLMSDGHSAGPAEFQGFALTLTVASGAEAARTFAALAEGGEGGEGGLGGKVRVPLGPTFFSSHFGMVTDRFGVLWIIYVAA